MGISLEGLPIELHRHILLQIIDRNSLRSLIHASPLFRSAYTTERARIQLAIDPTLLRNAVLTSQAQAGLEGKEKIETFRRLQRSYWNPPSSVRQLILTFAVRMQIVTFEELHRLVLTRELVNFLYSDLQDWFKDNHNVKPADRDFSFSTTEKYRLKRALYLYTIWSPLFGPNVGDSTRTIRTDAEKFLSRLKPAEIKELLIVMGYVRSRYALCFFESRKRDAEDQDGSVTEIEVEDLNPNGESYHHYLNTLIPHGPSLLSNLLQTKNRQAHQSLLPKHIPIQSKSIVEAFLDKPAVLRVILDSEMDHLSGKGVLDGIELGKFDISLGEVIRRQAGNVMIVRLEEGGREGRIEEGGRDGNLEEDVNF